MRSLLVAAALVAALIAPATGDGRPAGSGRAERAARSVAADLARFLSTTRAQLVATSRLPEVGSGAGGPACDMLLARRFGGDKHYTAWGVADAAAKLVCLSIPHPNPVDVSDRAYFRRAVATRAFAVGDYQIGRVTGTRSVVLAYPLLDGAAVRGVVFASVVLPFVGARVARGRVGDGGELLLVDSLGQLLAQFPADVAPLGERPKSPLVAAMFGRPSGHGRFPGLDGRRRTFAFRSVRGSRGHLRVAAGVAR